MSLSWNNEQFDNHGLAPANKYKQTYGADIKLEDIPVPTTIQKTVVEKTAPPIKEKKKHWLLRPVAWLVLLVSVYLMNAVINLFFLLGIYAVDWLSTLPTLAVILLTLAFGSVVISLLFSGAAYLPSLVIMASNSIYPSKNGVRYYIVGITQLLISILAIVLAITDSRNDHLFLDCLNSVYLAIVYIVMLASTKTIIDS